MMLFLVHSMNQCNEDEGAQAPFLFVKNSTYAMIFYRKYVKIIKNLSMPVIYRNIKDRNRKTYGAYNEVQAYTQRDS